VAAASAACLPLPLGSAGPPAGGAAGSETQIAFRDGFSAELTADHQAGVSRVANELTPRLIAGGHVTLGVRDDGGNEGEKPRAGQRRADAALEYLRGLVTMSRPGSRFAPTRDVGCATIGAGGDDRCAVE